jgi:hypothetical protein
LLGLVKADQPYRCVTETAKGTWDFHVSAEKQTINLFESNEACSHNLPNKVQVVDPNFKFYFEKEKIWRVTLGDNFSATAIKCDSADNCKGEKFTGTWSNVDDTSHIIDLSNGMTFIANYRYNVNSEVQEKTKGLTKNLDQVKIDDEMYESDCH